MLATAHSHTPEFVTILVVDDDALDRFVIRRSFDALGTPLELVEISDPRDAVAAIAKHKPAVTLLDIQMPGMDGFAVLAALQVARAQAEDKSESQGPILMLSSSDRQADKDRAIALGASDYRTKPCNLSDYNSLAEDIYSTYFYNQ